MIGKTLLWNKLFRFQFIWIFLLQSFAVKAQEKTLCDTQSLHFSQFGTYIYFQPITSEQLDKSRLISWEIYYPGAENGKVAFGESFPGERFTYDFWGWVGEFKVRLTYQSSNSRKCMIENKIQVKQTNNFQFNMNCNYAQKIISITQN